jgi:3-oxoisoapionate kinase
MSILYTFYGDDFTGSTDVLEQLASNGIPTVLYLTPPTAAHLAAFPEAKAIGIAGDSRSRSPEWMSKQLPGIFTTLKSFNAPIVHYKVCSTFDSSPTHGSIGRAIELGSTAFNPRLIPIVVGAPHLRRYVAFGNLFASAPDGAIHRIDRHPMSNHPVTPMREADLRIHLRAQTATPIGLIDLTALQSKNVSEVLEAQLAGGNQAILFDTIDTQTQTAVGELLWHEAQKQTIFSASSSGLTAALIHAWRDASLLPESIPDEKPGKAAPLLVLSGSCSPVTERQIRYALAHGYRGISLDPAALLSPDAGASAIASAMEAAATSLAAGRNTILYTSLGAADPSAVHGDRLGAALGSLLKEIVIRTGLRRVLLCGGDTASHAVPQLGLYALTWLANLQPGAPLCRAHADDSNSSLHHLELVLKGGQVGTEDFFDVVCGATR